MYDIEWQPKAYRQLKKIKERETLAAIKDAVHGLAHWPECRNIKAMTNHESSYRLRVVAHPVRCPGPHSGYYDSGGKKTQ